jgi:hypothetical protein
MERAVRTDEVEGRIRKRQSRPVSLDEIRIRQGARPRKLEELGHRVEPDYLAHERREGERERAGAGADVERALVSPRLGEIAHLFGKACRASVLPRRDALGRTGEALSRRRHGRRGSVRS